ncbi:helix-turn-helix domain-containing protein [Eggerthella sp. BIOML-A4]|uniref:helix-turn-helix domain-containing protein n=1 Tax=Eggerthella sp. BIOML-A4 TaxID=2584641 RepID=UPI0012B041AC|nr:helix-turn-helix transcriptional regulator [Eggerthella sp. BIOML-A4]MSA62379.1 helix-turn-helix domain-containing protein [Gordonibacter pamelaeae]MZK27863.1 helix-turn-helix domain-containing protein [Eggerthella sp. BIOML-A4]
MNTGELIRFYRKRKHLTQAGLGEAAGLSEPAIRNYELGNRTPDRGQLEKISKALGVTPDSLVRYEIESAKDVLGVLFQLEDEFGLVPQEGGTLGIDPKSKNAQKLDAAIKAWSNARDELARGEMTEDDYRDWRARLQA